MATLVLTTIGTAIGGPLGGAFGALIGQSVDSRLLAPAGRSGPRLSDLRVQTSHYGTAIPRLFGRMRVAGTVIWATDLIERRTRTSNGKGRGSTTSYSYAASFAVALSSRPIAGIGRIWAEGNLLRGSDGRFTSALQFRLHHGDEDQGVDPLIAAAEGIGACPAYRGIAYAVFEGMDLAPFGNRIPSLSFEVIGDAEPVTIGSILADAIPGAEIFAPGPQVTGYAQSAVTRRDAVQNLQPLMRARRLPGSGWRIGSPAGDASTVRDPGPAAVTRRGGRGQTRYGSAVQRPARIGVRHHDPARDYLSSLQSATLPGATGAEEIADLPLASDAATARTIAAGIARRVDAAASLIERPSGFAALACPVGALVRHGSGRMLEVREREIEDGHIALMLRPPEAELAAGGGVGDGGRGLLTPDLPVGDGFAFVFDLPRWEELLLDDGAGGTMAAGGPVVIAAGTGAGWRGADVDITPGAGAATSVVGRVAASAVVGQIVAVNAAAQSTLIDEEGWIDVALLRPDMVLADAGMFDLLAGSNMAMAGAELIQFARAEPIGGTLWRLRRLLRGRIGTEAAMANLLPGAPFALVEGAAPLRLPASIGLLPLSTGAEIGLALPGSDSDLTLTMPEIGRARLPLSPVHLRHHWQDDDALAISWIRRSHAGHGWHDGSEVPLDEVSESYQLTIVAGALALTRGSTAPVASLTAGDVAMLRAAAATAEISVRQIGARGASPAAVITIAL